MKTKLFETNKVKKFFNILSKLDRHVPIKTEQKNYRYYGYDPLNPDICLCEREIFVKRTLKKWFSGKKLVWYKVSELTNSYYKCYISINSIRFGLGYSDYLTVYYTDFSKPLNFNEIKITHNDVLRLEGEWKDADHDKVLKMFLLDIPEKEYVFKTYDFEKYKSRKRKGETKEDKMKAIEGSVSFSAKTELEAYNKKEKYRKESNLMVSSDILEIKNVHYEKHI